MRNYITRLYKPSDNAALYDMMLAEDGEWSDYYDDSGISSQFQVALNNCIVYVVVDDDDTACGFIRVRNDDGFFLVVYDLLVHKKYRGKNCGRILIDRVCKDYPGIDVYVMSDEDGYYEKQGFNKVGSIFELS